MSLEIRGPAVAGSEKVLTPEFLAFLERHVRKFSANHEHLLDRRREDHAHIRRGELKLEFDPATRGIREGDWQIAPLPDEFWEEGIELTGPADSRKMVINALNSGAVRYMLDFEDSLSPTWRNIINGHINLMDAVRGTITYRDEAKGKDYTLGPKLAKLMVRPRGLNEPEPRVLVDGKPVPAALFDEAAFVFHNAAEMVHLGKALHLYFPKRETPEEARYDNLRLLHIENERGLEWHSVKVTYLNENLRATFAAHEIIWETRLRNAGFNVGRYDEMASMERMLFRQLFPERRQVTMFVPLLDCYVDVVGSACYPHGAPLYGGMEAQIPVNDDPEFSARALAKATAGKTREANEKGCVRAWVAHPGMIKSMQAIFQNRPEGWYEEAKERYADLAFATTSSIATSVLTTAPIGAITREGFTEQTDAMLIYLANWYAGTGAVGITYVDAAGSRTAVAMDDLATVEQARTQSTKSLLLGAHFDDGGLIDRSFMEGHIAERVAAVRDRISDAAWKHMPLAVETIHELLDCTEETFPEYLTDVAFPKLIELENQEG